MKGRRQVKEGVLSLDQLRHGLCMCAVQRVNGKTKDVSAFEWGIVVGARLTSLSVSIIFFHIQKFPVCIKNGPPPKGHQANITQLWEALASTWVSIPVECFRHLVESMPQRIEAVLRTKGGATQY